MAGGSQERETPRDQQCTHCGLFYSPRGIASHEDNCPQRPELPMTNEPDDKDPKPDDQPEPTDPDPPEPDADPDPPEPDTEPEQTLTIPRACPSCGNPDDGNSPKIWKANLRFERHLQSQGKWTPTMARVIDRNDYVCGRCTVAFTESEGRQAIDA